jgi:hypothetical protein
MVDVDNDGDLDLALTDETTDHLKILQNGGGPVSPCPPAPNVGCLQPIASAASSLVIQRKSPLPGKGDRLGWKWGKGADTQIADFGNPPNDGYLLCVYDAGAIVLTTPWRVAA